MRRRYQQAIGSMKVFIIGGMLAIIAISLLFPAVTARAAEPNRMSFTYDATEYYAESWTSSELTTLKGWVQKYYPLMVQVYGAPSRSSRVNIAKDSASGSPGYYMAWGNMFVLQSATQPDVFVHELAHAFRGYVGITSSIWEEGMARAAELEVLHLANDDHYSVHHSYAYDVYFDAHNTPAIGVKEGNIYGNGSPALALMRYNLSSYIWTKMMIEDPTFMPRFNAALYANPSLINQSANLHALVISLKPTVERQATASWMNSQGILNTNPSSGCYLYQRISNFTVDAFCRESSGYEQAQANVVVTYKVYDHVNNLLSSSQGTTSANGFVSPWVTWPDTYRGRIKVVASATINGAALTNTVYRTTDVEAGVFGVMTNVSNNSMTVSSPTNAFSPFVTTIKNGSFSAPQLASYRGQVTLTYSPLTGTVSKTFTKDASNYFVQLTTPKPATITIVSGSNQSAKLNKTYAKQLQVKVVDAAGLPINNAQVVFTVPASGASGRFSGSSTVTVRTNTAGIATAPIITANGTVGKFTVTAAAAELSSRASFTLTNTK